MGATGRRKSTIVRRMMGFKVLPTLFENFLQFFESNPRQFSLHSLHVLLIRLAKLHLFHKFLFESQYPEKKKEKRKLPKNKSIKIINSKPSNLDFLFLTITKEEEKYINEELSRIKH
uniref:Uncharacterized protein n=2 Tax=Opuntia streptacantha TaxID=393608 RepID=A0A7C9ATV2_OPUST